MRSHGPRGIASGAKIRFARCRLHPRASPPTYLRSAGSIRATPTYHPIARPLWPRSPVHPRRHPSAPCLESSNEHRPLILPTATLHRRPNSIPYGPQALQLNHPSSPCLISLSLSLSLPSLFLSFSLRQTFRFVSFADEFSRGTPPSRYPFFVFFLCFLPPVGLIWFFLQRKGF